MKVAVIGDVIKDVYVYGTAERLSPEAPVPIIRHLKTVATPGGAANLFENLKSLGVDCEFVQPENRWPSVKTRVFCDGHYVTRIDEDKHVNGDEVWEYIRGRDFSQYEYVILSDYRKGALDRSKDIIPYLSKFGCKVIVDPKRSHTEYTGAWLVKPNESEYDKFGFSKWNGNIITTKAGNSVLSRFDGRQLLTPVTPVEVSDVTGAGDCFLAAFVYGLTKNYSYDKCLDIATRAASVSVTHPGTYILKLQDIEHTVVFTNGCFDILHRGHIEYLQQSRKLGNKLIVGVNSDKSVRRLKGSDRPINNQEDRATALSALACVDEVYIFDEDTPIELIKKLQPDIITKGGDYRPEQVVGNDLADVVILPYLKDYSTTNIVSKLND